MLLKDTSPQQFPESSWPNCPNLDDLCPIYKMAQILGADVQNLLVSFIGGWRPGG